VATGVVSGMVVFPRVVMVDLVPDYVDDNVGMALIS
jgi:hypothetical protein